MNLISRKANRLVRLGMVHLLSGAIPLYVINEYPRSGGTWVGQMLGEALGVPFPMRRFPVLRPSIMHGHYLHPWGMKNVVVVWRDGRDVMVSLYHYWVFRHKRVQYSNNNNISKNLPAFIEYAATTRRSPHFWWADFVRRWHARKDAVHVRYEDLHRDTARELQRIVAEVSGQQLTLARAAEIAEAFSFSRRAGRQSGEEEKYAFFRKGVVGDWHNYFDRSAREVFDLYAGSELTLLGYEPDSTWVSADKLA